MYFSPFDCFALSESRRIQLQFATNRIKTGPFEPEIQTARGARRQYAKPMASRDVIGLPPVTISLATLYNSFMTVEDYTKETYEISCAQLPYRRCASTMFVIYNSARDSFHGGSHITPSPIKYHFFYV